MDKIFGRLATGLAAAIDNGMPARRDIGIAFAHQYIIGINHHWVVDAVDRHLEGPSSGRDDRDVGRQRRNLVARNLVAAMPGESAVGKPALPAAAGPEQPVLSRS